MYHIKTRLFDSNISWILCTCLLFNFNIYFWFVPWGFKLMLPKKTTNKKSRKQRQSKISDLKFNPLISSFSWKDKSCVCLPGISLSLLLFLLSYHGLSPWLQFAIFSTAVFWSFLFGLTISKEGLISHLSQSSISPSIPFSLIGKSRSNTFLELTNTKQWGLSVMLKKTMEAFDGVQTYNWQINRQMRYPLCHAAPRWNTCKS